MELNIRNHRIEYADIMKAEVKFPDVGDEPSSMVLK